MENPQSIFEDFVDSILRMHKFFEKAFEERKVKITTTDAESISEYGFFTEGSYSFYFSRKIEVSERKYWPEIEIIFSGKLSLVKFQWKNLRNKKKDIEVVSDWFTPDRLSFPEVLDQMAKFLKWKISEDKLSRESFIKKFDSLTF